MHCSRKRNSALSRFLWIALVAISGCAPNQEPSQPESIDPAHLSGRWEIQSGDETEWFNLAVDGSFTATIDRDGFIATTLSQGPHVTVRGQWKLTGRTITFALDHSSDPNLEGQIHAYEITEVTDRSLDTVDARGNKRTLTRGL